MYYQEKIINGKLMLKTSPFGKWREASLQRYKQRLMESEAMLIEKDIEINSLINDLTQKNQLC